MVIHVNAFRGDDLIAAYITEDDDVPSGVVVGRQGNAVLLENGDEKYVVSRPRCEGDILDVLPEARTAPMVDLSEYFSRS